MTRCVHVDPHHPPHPVLEDPTQKCKEMYTAVNGVCLSDENQDGKPSSCTSGYVDLTETSLLNSVVCVGWSVGGGGGGGGGGG